MEAKFKGRAQNMYAQYLYFQRITMIFRFLKAPTTTPGKQVRLNCNLTDNVCENVTKQ